MKLDFEKTSNLIVIEDKETTNINGLTYSIKNGVVTLSGKSKRLFVNTESKGERK